MSKAFKNIMLVTNDPADTQGAEKTAMNLARRFQARVVIVDTIKTPFFPQRFPTISTEIIYEAAVNAKTKYLTKVQTKFAQQGIQTTTEVIVGHRTSSELIGTVTKNDCDLVVRYMKGQSSRREGRYGETAANLMRACPVPVLLTQQEIADPKVLVCINLDHGPEENQSLIENARRLVASPGDLFVLSCWEYSGSEFMIQYIDEGMAQTTKTEAAQMYGKLFERLLSTYRLDDLGDRSFLLNKNPITAIPNFCSQHDIDIAVMCSASLNHPLGRSLGSTIERTIGELPCSLVTVKPIGFRPAHNSKKLMTAHA